MNRRDLVLAILALGAVPLALEARAAGKPPRIGFLSPISRDDFLLEPFRQGLREVGYVEGQTIVIEYRFAEGRPEQLPALAAELVRLKVDVIVASSPPAPLAARGATSTIPVVFIVIGDPVAEGFVASLARPGGNITGLASIAPELMGKQLDLLKQVTPKASRMAVLQNPNNHGHPPQLRQAQDAARALGLQLHVIQASSAADLDAAFAAMSSQSIGGVLVLRDALFRTQRTQIAALAVKSRLPAMYGNREYTEVGGLMALGVDNSILARRAAVYVDKIIKGARPADLPVEQPTKFEFIINLKAAKALGRTIPKSLLQRADEVIE